MAELIDTTKVEGIMDISKEVEVEKTLLDNCNKQKIPTKVRFTIDND